MLRFDGLVCECVGGIRRLMKERGLVLFHKEGFDRKIELAITGTFGKDSVPMPLMVHFK